MNYRWAPALFLLTSLILVGCKPAPGINPPTPAILLESSPVSLGARDFNTPSPALVTPAPTLRSTQLPSPSTAPMAENHVASKFTITSLPSAYFSDELRDTNTVDTIVIHSLYNPESSTPFSVSSAKMILDKYQVSTHYLIDRDGGIWRLVPDDRQAWHAGESMMPSPDSRTKVNLFSIGIELIGSETSKFTEAQYASLVQLTADVLGRLPITTIVGHDDIAPGRKTDPWGFDWDRYQTNLKSTTPKQIRFLN